MKTKGDCMALFLRYLDEATKKGVELPSTKNADYRDKFNHFLNEAQIYIASMVKIPAVFTVTQNPIPNQLGDKFEMQQFLPGNDIVLTGTGSKSYYFEIDNVGTVYIKVNGITVQTINNTSKKQFTAYKGNIASNPTDTVTITFTGPYPFNFRNTALYEYSFPLDADVPDYTPYVSYNMPSDFMSFDSVVIKTDPRVYAIYSDHKWENNKKVILDYNEKGSFEIHYFKYPAVILPTAQDNTPLDIEDKAVDLVVLQAGIMATAADNPALSSWLRSLYIEKAQNVINAVQTSENSVQTVYSIM